MQAINFYIILIERVKTKKDVCNLVNSLFYSDTIDSPDTPYVAKELGLLDKRGRNTIFNMMS